MRDDENGRPHQMTVPHALWQWAEDSSPDNEGPASFLRNILIAAMAAAIAKTKKQPEQQQKQAQPINAAARSPYDRIEMTLDKIIESANREYGSAMAYINGSWKAIFVGFEKLYNLRMAGIGIGDKFIADITPSKRNDGAYKFEVIELYI